MRSIIFCNFSQKGQVGLPCLSLFFSQLSRLNDLMQLRGRGTHLYYSRYKFVGKNVIFATLSLYIADCKSPQIEHINFKEVVLLVELLV